MKLNGKFLKSRAEILSSSSPGDLRNTVWKEPQWTWRTHRISEGYTLTRRRQWHPTPVLLPGKSHGRRSLEGCSPWGRWGSDTTERLHFHFSLSCIAEGNGNPLQCSCLENPRDGEAWWAAICGVTQSRIRLKGLSSSSSSSKFYSENWICTGKTSENFPEWRNKRWSERQQIKRTEHRDST